MEAPGYWDQVEQSQAGMRELNTLKEEKEKFESLQEQYEDIETLLEMGYEENEIQMIGPVRAPVYKVNDIYRKILYIKQENYDILIHIRKMAEQCLKEAQGLESVVFQSDLT